MPSATRLSRFRRVLGGVVVAEMGAHMVDDGRDLLSTWLSGGMPFVGAGEGPKGGPVPRGAGESAANPQAFKTI